MEGGEGFKELWDTTEEHVIKGGMVVNKSERADGPKQDEVHESLYKICEWDAEEMNTKKRHITIGLR